jgi:DNA-binding XRE family transcriptional regulator
MSVQIIERDGRPEWAVIPYAEYQRMVARLEELQDVADAEAALAAIDRGDEELIPGEIVDRLHGGENRLKIWREYRGLTQAALAGAADVSQGMITMIETGRRGGSVAVLKRLAGALRLEVDDLTG